MGSTLAKVMAFWPLAVFAMPILLGIGLLWLRTKFADIAALSETQKDVAGLKTQFEVFEVRLDTLEKAHDEEPTRAQVIDKIGDAVERLSRVEAGIEGANRQLQTQGQWIQALALPEGRR